MSASEAIESPAPLASPRAARRKRSDAQPTGGPGQSPLGRVLPRVTLLLVCLAWTVPTLGLLISSVRPRDAIANSGWWTVFARPFEFVTNATFEHYSTVLNAGMGPAFFNSLVVSIPATVIPILVAAFAAYAFAWMRFPGREILFVVIVGLMVVPIQATFIPLLRLFGQFGITGSFVAVWLAHAGFGMPLAIYLLRNYMGSLPRPFTVKAGAV